MRKSQGLQDMGWVKCREGERLAVSLFFFSLGFSPAAITLSSQ